MDKKMLIMTVFLFTLAGLGGLFIGRVDSTQSKQKVNTESLVDFCIKDKCK